MRALLIAALLLAGGLTGCIGSDGTDGREGATAANASGAEGAPAAMPGAGSPHVNLSFETGQAVHETRWANGSFTLAEHSFPKGVATGLIGEYDPDRREIDLADLVPQGIPVVLTAEIEAELGEGDVDIWFDVPSEEVWAATYHTPYGGYSRIETTVLRTSSEPVTLNVRYDEIDDSQGFDYTLWYSAQADPSILPAGVPVGVEVPTGATGLEMRFLSPGGGNAGLLWDPQDAFLGRGEQDVLTFELEDESPRGEYVLMAAEGASPARVTVLGTEQAPSGFRLLEQTFETGPGVEAVPGESEVAWTFDVRKAPLQAGVFWSASEASQGTGARLSSPQADLLELNIDGGPWVGAGFGTTTDMGAPGLTTGTYEAQVSFDQNAGPTGMTANHVLVYYERGT